MAGEGTKTDRYHISHISIYDLRRSGPYVIVDFGIVCAQGDGSSGCNTESAFGNAFHNGDPIPTFNTVGGLALIDPVQHKEYREVVNSQNRPYCSAIGRSPT